MPVLAGARGTQNIEQSQREVDMANTIDLLEPSEQPLAVLSRKAGKQAAISPKFEWLEDELQARFDATGATALVGDTNIVVVDSSKFAVHDIVKNTRTKENIRVTAIVNATNITVVRGVGSTAVAMNLADELLILCSAQSEGDDVKTPNSINPVNVFNYTQIFRDPFKATDTLRASTMRHNPQEWPYQARKKGIEHAKSIEYAYIFGTKSLDTSAAQPRRTTGGVLSFIATNQTAVGGVMTESVFNTTCRQGFRYGSKSKLFVAAPLVVSVLNGYPLGKLQFRQDDSTYGLNIGRFVSPFGVLNVVNHWLLEKTIYGGYGIGIDIDQVIYRYLAGNGINRDTKVLPERQGNGEDARTDEYLTETGLQFGHERKHFLVTGVTG